MSELPAEIWGHVFSRILKPADLLRAALVCREFRSIALRSLYRDLIYREPRQFLANLGCWHDPLALVPESLVLSISYLSDGAFSRYDPSVALVDPDGNVESAHPAAHNPDDPRPLNSSLHLHSTPESQSTSLAFLSSQNSYFTTPTSHLKSTLSSKTFLSSKIFSFTTASSLPNQRTLLLWMSSQLLQSRD